MNGDTTNNKLKISAIIFGIVLLIIGILGFVPSANPNGYLFGLFHVNAAHNIIHLMSGIIALWCGLSSESTSRLYFRVFGIVYGIIAILGLYYQNEAIFGIVANNIHDIWLHAVISVTSLVLGYGCCCSSSSCCPKPKDQNNKNNHKDHQ